ncbi:MAG: MMPL family transporter [Deltaproteobacteria bacterium]|nr:MMPL family transporter [Deltaproteobacteria bacterium]
MNTPREKSLVVGVGSFAARRPLVVIAVWLALLVGALVAAERFGLRFADALEVPGSESQRAASALERHFPSRGSSASIVLVGRGAALTPDDARVKEFLEAVVHVPHVTQVSPLMPSADGRAWLGQLAFDRPGLELKSSADALAALAAHADPSLEVAFGGEVISVNQAPDPGRAELIGLAAALLVMVLAFRSVVAAVLPLVTAMIASGIGIVIVGLIGRSLEVSSAAPMLASMLGLGVGIDYSLFFVTRLREELARGHALPEAIEEAVAHSGPTVLFAGLSVVVALAGLTLTGISLLMALGLAAALVVLLSALAAVTLLPAFARLTGRWLGRNAAENDGAVFARLSRQVARRPALFAVGAVAVLLLVATPALQLRLGFPDDSAQPEGSMARRAYELVATHFGPGVNGAIVLVVEDDARTDLATRVSELASRDVAVAAVTPPIPAPDGLASLVLVTPRAAPQEAEVSELVHRLRSSLVPSLRSSGAQRVSVGGVMAMTMDVSELIEAKLPLVISGVLAATFLLLMMVFRSVLVPLKAVLMNLLSVGAAYGVLVVVFQWGVGRRLVGLDHALPIASLLPLILFALLFGLSMDYEVFLLSRVREEHERGLGTGESVAQALAKTGRVVTSAAAIMVAVFTAFALGPDPMIKMFGVGLASAILLDATIIRLVLVPATMVLLGEANWWFPRRLARWLPAVRVE